MPVSYTHLDVYKRQVLSRYAENGIHFFEKGLLAQTRTASKNENKSLRPNYPICI